MKNVINQYISSTNISTIEYDIDIPKIEFNIEEIISI